MAQEEAPVGSGGAPATVFVSYSRDDKKRALSFIKFIEDAGYSVWWDGLLGGGERYARTTEAAIESARAVVVLWSKISVASHWVHDEATRGRDRRCLVPVSIDGVPPPLGFGQFQTLDMARAKLRGGDPASDRLIAAIAAFHASEPQPALPASSRRAIDRRWMLGGGAAVVAAGAGAFWLKGGLRFGAKSNSVAVLPFVNLSGDPEQTYFSDGLAAELRAELAQNPLLQVVAQASSATFRDHQQDAKTIARKLSVSYLLDGNVRKSGDKLRVSVELAEGATGFSLWSQTFDRPLADVFAVQDEIARAVVSALSAEMMNDGGNQSVSSGGTKNLEAFDAYLRGRALYELETDEQSARLALAKFDEAVAKDPGYPAAWSARSRTLAAIANQYLDGESRSATFDAAIVSANRALKLAPQMADAHSALAFATFFGRRNARAARIPYERSAELGQGEADVLTRFALYCARTARFEQARTAIARAVTLDPLNALTQRSVGAIEYVARRYPESITAYERALVLNPEQANTRAFIGFSQYLMGQIDQAAATVASEKSALRRLVGVAIVAHRQGKRGEAQQALDELIAKYGDGALYEQTQILAQWGDVPEAAATLVRANRSGDPGIVLIRTDPLVDALRATPEYSDLLKQVGFD